MIDRKIMEAGLFVHNPGLYAKIFKNQEGGGPWKN
jgi:hypothetical protein